ncbi:MAG: DUF6755 family protein [Chitinophagaceae bacterium]
MSMFRDTQNNANKQKQNQLSSIFIFLLILIITLQVWFLYSCLNIVLQDRKEVLVPATMMSCLLCLAGIIGLYFLPQGKKS